MKLVVIGVDPGLMTGLFRFSTHLGDTICELTHLAADEKSVVDTFNTLLPCRGAPDVRTHVFLERYFITQKTVKLSRQPAALEVSGMIVNHSDKHGNVTVHRQAKSDVAKLASDAVLKDAGWYKPGTKHWNDAARHALGGLASVSPSTFQLVVTGGIVVNNE